MKYAVFFQEPSRGDWSWTSIEADDAEEAEATFRALPICEEYDAVFVCAVTADELRMYAKTLEESEVDHKFIDIYAEEEEEEEEP